MTDLKKVGWNILVGFDQFINMITFGDPDMTVSRRLGKYYTGSVVEIGVDYIAYLITGKKNHCEDAAKDGHR